MLGDDVSYHTVMEGIVTEIVILQADDISAKCVDTYFKFSKGSLIQNFGNESSPLSNPPLPH
jgi:hypothetical protein